MLDVIWLVVVQFIRAQQFSEVSFFQQNDDGRREKEMQKCLWWVLALQNPSIKLKKPKLRICYYKWAIFWSVIINKSCRMSIIIRSLSANLTRDVEILHKMDPYIKILFGGHEYKTSICEGGGKNPTFSEAFSMVPAGDPNMHVQVWDSDMIKDDIVGEGTYNLRLLESRPNMRSENEHIDLFYDGKCVGRVLFSVQLKDLKNFWGETGAGLSQGQQLPQGQGLKGQQQYTQGQQGYGQGQGYSIQGQVGVGQPGFVQGQQGQGQGMSKPGYQTTQQTDPKAQTYKGPQNV